MILITLVMVLTIERIAATGPYWQFNFYYHSLLTRLLPKEGTTAWLSHRLGRWLLFIVPFVLISWLRHLLPWTLLTFCFDVLVLLICIGCYDKRQLYKSFLNAATRRDEQGCHYYAELLQQQDVGLQQSSTETESSETNEQDGQCNSQSRRRLGLTLVWFNYQYYCAVLFWFVVLGAPGAVLYCMVRQASLDTGRISQYFADQWLARVLHVLDWLPARVCSAGYLLIGDFTRSAGIWLSYLLDFTSPARNLVCEIAANAEVVNLQDDDKILEPACMLKLAKRNILFFLAMVAILTLYGGIA